MLSPATRQESPTWYSAGQALVSKELKSETLCVPYRPYVGMELPLGPAVYAVGYSVISSIRTLNPSSRPLKTRETSPQTDELVE